jgi:hypothetical protein
MTDRAPLADTEPVPEGDPKRRIAYFKLHYFLSDLTEDKLLAKRLAIRIHTWIIHYYQSRRGLKVRKHKGHIVIESSPTSKKAVADLQRLARAKGDYAWAKAWHEMSRVAHRAIADVSDGIVLRYRDDPDFLFVPLRADIEPLIDRAIQAAREAARRYTTAKPERDRAVVDILRAYRYFTGKRPTAKPAEVFVSKIEVFYSELLPDGFEGWRSKATLQKLILESLSDH